MAASANPLATRAGLEILRSGGSAVDAAIAIQLVLGLVEPQSSGLGGGAFLLYWDGKQVVALDGRETAPMAADERLFLTPAGTPMAFYDAVVGGRSVGTPGAVRLLETAHRRYGKLPWPRLFEPAIRLGEDGFAMSPRLNQLLAAEKYLKNDPAAAAYFYGADGLPKATGTILRNPDYAATLRAIAAGGADAFYSGAIADGRREGGPVAEERGQTRGVGPERVPREVARTGLHRIQGMARLRDAAALVGRNRGGTDAAASSPTATSPCFLPVTPRRSSPAPTRSTCSPKPGAWPSPTVRVYVADSDFVQVDVAGLLDPDYLKQRAQLIGPRSMGVAAAGVPPGTVVAWSPDPSPPRTATSHISVVDDNGHAVAMTTTIEDVFGVARDGARLSAEQPADRLLVRASG